MPHPFLNKDLSFSRAKTLLALSRKESLYVEENRLFFDGDHWQRGKGYTGPTVAQNDKNAHKTLAKIERLFTSKNIVNETVRRQANALLVRMPMLSFDLAEEREKVPQKDFTPPPTMPDAQPPMVDRPLTEDEQKDIDEARKAFDSFWATEEVQAVLKRWFKRRLWGGRAALRLFIPARYVSWLQEGHAKRPKTLRDAIKLISLDEPDITAARVFFDRPSGFYLGLTAFKLVTDSTGRTLDKIEVTFDDDEGLTYVATLSSESSKQTQAAPTSRQQPPSDDNTGNSLNAILPPIDPGSLSSGLDLDGELVVYETVGAPFVSQQMKELNKFVNLSLTMGGHVMVETGYSEMALTNVALDEDEEIDDPDHPGKKIKKQKEIRRGMGVLNNFVGLGQTDASGNDSYATPEVIFKDPSPIDTHVQGKQLGYEACLEEAHQLHALITGDAAVSGEARKQALVDFVADCLDFKVEVDAMGAWLMRASVLMAAAIIGESERFKVLKATFDSKLYVGELSADERRVVLEEVEKRVRSRKSARALLGIMDNDAEEDQVRQEQKEDAMINQATQPIDPATGLPPGIGQPPNPNQPPRPGGPQPPAPRPQPSSQ